MGIKLVNEVSVRHGHLSGNAYKVLICMSVHALDPPGKDGRPPDIYFGGWKVLALALGYDVPTGDDEESRRRSRVPKRMVAKAVAELTRAGLVEGLVDKPRTRQRQCYQLTLRVSETDTLSMTDRVSETDTLRVSETDTHQGVQNVHNRVTVRSPLGTTEEQRQDLLEDTFSSVTAQGTDRARGRPTDGLTRQETDKTKSKNATTRRTCPDCGHDKFAGDGSCLRCTTRRPLKLDRRNPR